MSASVQRVVQGTHPLVVGVRVSRVVRGRRRTHRASGLIIAPGHLLTNAHVVRHATGLEVEYADGARFPATVQGADTKSDLAVLTAQGTGNEVLRLAGDARPRIGELAVSVSNPLGMDRSASLGVVSSLYRRLRMRSGVLDGLLQADVAAAPGASGGALLGLQGQVIGVMVANNVRQSRLAFAIPAGTAEWVAEQLLLRGEAPRPRLGMRVQTAPFPPAWRPRVATPQSHVVYVHEVEPGSPADDAGLAADDWLLSASGVPLEGTHLLPRHVGIRQAGADVEIGFMRGNEMQSAHIRPPFVPPPDA